MNLSPWNKLILLFVFVIGLILINKTINLDNLFGFKQKALDSFITNPTPTTIPTQPIQTPATNSAGGNPTASPSIPTPTILKSIQRIRNGDFESDN